MVLSRRSLNAQRQKSVTVALSPEKVSAPSSGTAGDGASMEGAIVDLSLAKVTADASNAGRPHPLGGPSSQHVSALGQRQKKCLTSRLS